MASAPRERGWRLLLAALLLALAVPLVALFRLVVPIEQTILLIATAIASCAIAGWAGGGSAWLALVWSGLALWLLLVPITGSVAFQALSRGWALMLASSFGVVSAVGSRKPFLARALAATAMAAAIGLALFLFSRSEPQELVRHVRDEMSRRLAAAAAQWDATARTSDWRDFTQKYPSGAAWMEQGQQQLRAIPAVTVALFPALLALESIAVLALAWSLYHRSSRTRIGAPLRRLSEFRFNDQLVWGLVLGVTMLVVPTLREARAVGENLVVFFAALYALRGLGVLDWFLATRGMMRMLFYLAIFLAWPVVGVFAIGLGLGDTWIDWRGRARATT